MHRVEMSSASPSVNHGWRVTLAGLGINLALGILYSWSVISNGVPAEWRWSQEDKNRPFSGACLVFSIFMGPAVLVLGIAFLIIVLGLAQLLAPPPPGYVPAGTPAALPKTGPQRKEEYRPLEMLRTWQFYLLWFMYACGAGAGLMIIAIIVK